MSNLNIYLMLVGIWIAGWVSGWMVRDIQRDKREADECHQAALREMEAREDCRPARDEAALELLRTNPKEFFRQTRRQLP